jgi:glycosyltransferase involved in cell wall biosynthesis
LRTVLIDLRRATSNPQLGISRYVRNLVHEMAQLEPEDVRIVGLDLAGGHGWEVTTRVVGNGNDLAQRFVQEQFKMATAARQGDLLHLPWYEGPVAPRCPLVLTLFDLDTLENAGLYSARFRFYYNTLLRIHVRRARAIIVSSESSLARLEARWPGRPYVLIPLGVDPVFRPGPPHAPTEAPYVLYTGGFGPRKRFPDLLEAFDQLRTRHADVRLVITGDPLPPDHALLAQRGTTRITLAGRVDDAHLADLYRGARVVVYPSDLEGFGFPLVEGFASGTPVVACAGGSIPEVAGGAALLVEPRRPDDLADALLTVIGDPGLATRMREKGLARARCFDWAQTARRTLDVYRQVLA